ncbi:MAG: restriction endonuclease [Ardenticatenales bacterium]|nr:restriction endonuclease [Ardenticatenales bacterium]
MYLDIRIARFKSTLERFNPEHYLNIYAIDSMDGYQFEAFLVELYTRLGYDVEPTRKGADQGADLFVERFGRRIVIQAKNYKDNVGNSAVQQAHAAKTFYECDEAMVVTNSYFTPSARELAVNAQIRLVDRDELTEYIDQYNQFTIELANQS